MTLFFFLSPFLLFFPFYFFFYILSLLTYFCFCSHQPYPLLTFYTPNWGPFFLTAPSVLLFTLKSRLDSLSLSYCFHWPLLLLPLYTIPSRQSSLLLLLCFHFTLPAILNLLNAPTVLFSQSSLYTTSAGLPFFITPTVSTLLLSFHSPVSIYSLHCSLLLFTLAIIPTGLPS